MKRLVFLTVFLLPIFSMAQPEGIKPGISINGMPCLIQNLVFSCVPRTCDSVVIEQGDSIEFCTYQQISLNTDTAYWLRWHFNGAANLPDTIVNNYPSQVPLCYWPRWDSVGTFTVEVFYNGVLTAYPSADCYQQGPSHWYIKVVVLPDPNAVEEQEEEALLIAPNPSTGLFTLRVPQEKVREIVIRDLLGRTVLRTTEGQFDLSSFGPGLYTACVILDSGMCTEKLIVE